VPPVRCGYFEDLRRQIALLVLRREETPKVLADDFVDIIALKPFGTSIPGDDPATPAKHVDGVIRHRVDEEMKALRIGLEIDKIGWITRHRQYPTNTNP
jgi:hypothetical protein